MCPPHAFFMLSGNASTTLDSRLVGAVSNCTGNFPRSPPHLWRHLSKSWENGSVHPKTPTHLRTGLSLAINTKEFPKQTAQTSHT